VRLRTRFTKLGKVRFTSHRDVARMWERALRRASVPVAYTEGFSTRPKLHFGLALSTGYESLAEYVDVDLDVGRLDGLPPLDDVRRQLSEALPGGIDVTAVAEVDRQAPSLQQAVTSCTWSITVVEAPPAAVADRVAEVLAAPSLPVVTLRKGRPMEDDLRPHLSALRLSPPCSGADGPVLEAELGTQPRSVRPRELLAVLHPDWEERAVRRVHQWMSHDGDRREPLALPAVDPSRVGAEVPAR
jgi:radical SAM-linked protein